MFIHLNLAWDQNTNVTERNTLIIVAHAINRNSNHAWAKRKQ